MSLPKTSACICVHQRLEIPQIVLQPSPIHGLGVFASADLPAGTRVLEYVGHKITKHESMLQCELNNPYLFALDEEWHLNGNVPWNPARHVNHSCTPNCEAVRDQSGIGIVALRNISRGEEITFNYGYDLEDYRQHPCRCGAPGCVGFIVAEEFFDHARINSSVTSR